MGRLVFCNTGDARVEREREGEVSVTLVFLGEIAFYHGRKHEPKLQR